MDMRVNEFYDDCALQMFNEKVILGALGSRSLLSNQLLVLAQVGISGS